MEDYSDHTQCIIDVEDVLDVFQTVTDGENGDKQFRETVTLRAIKTVLRWLRMPEAYTKSCRRLDNCTFICKPDSLPNERCCTSCPVKVTLYALEIKGKLFIRAVIDLVVLFNSKPLAQLSYHDEKLADVTFNSMTVSWHVKTAIFCDEVPHGKTEAEIADAECVINTKDCDNLWSSVRAVIRKGRKRPHKRLRCKHCLRRQTK